MGAAVRGLVEAETTVLLADKLGTTISLLVDIMDPREVWGLPSPPSSLLLEILGPREIEDNL